MKRYGNLYEKAFSDEQIMLSILSASKTKRKNREVQIVLKDPEPFIKQIKENPHITGKYREKIHIDESSNKERLLEIPPFFPDQVIQHCLIDSAGWVMERQFLPECCCSIIQRGALYASRLVRENIRRKMKYYVKFDIHHFFQSIDHDILKRMLRKLYKDKRLLASFDEIIDSNKNGIPIGNYTSQDFANLYLTGLDRYIKQTLKIKGYVRYMDDFVIMGRNKRELKKAIPLILDYVKDKLHLETHYHEHYENIRDHPLDLCGFRHGRERVIMRKRIWRRARRCLLRQHRHISKARARRLMSYLGYLKYSDSHKIINDNYSVIMASKRSLQSKKNKNKRSKRKWKNKQQNTSCSVQEVITSLQVL